MVGVEEVEQTLREIWNVHEAHPESMLLPHEDGVARIDAEGCAIHPVCQECAGEGCETCGARGVTDAVPMTEDQMRSLLGRIANAQPAKTHAEYKAALKDDETPEAVKKAIRQHLYGAQPIRRGRVIKMNSPASIPRDGKDVLKPLQATNKPRRPQGMSGRQWKRMRKENDRKVREFIREHTKQDHEAQ